MFRKKDNRSLFANGQFLKLRLSNDLFKIHLFCFITKITHTCKMQ